MREREREREREIQDTDTRKREGTSKGKLKNIIMSPIGNDVRMTRQQQCEEDKRKIQHKPTTHKTRDGNK